MVGMQLGLFHRFDLSRILISNTRRVMASFVSDNSFHDNLQTVSKEGLMKSREIGRRNRTVKDKNEIHRPLMSGSRSGQSCKVAAASVLVKT